MSSSSSSFELEKGEKSRILSTKDDRIPATLQQQQAAEEEEDPLAVEASCTMTSAIVFTIALVAGTFSAVMGKSAFQSESIGLTGEREQFDKPIMMLLLMFAAMSPALLFWYINQLSVPPKDREVIDKKTFMILIIPCVCDLLCSLLLMVAQLYITASLWQMMRGTVIIVTAVLKRFVLKSRLRIHMWIGVLVITIAMILVASTTFIKSKGEISQPGQSDPQFGILLVIIGCLAQGVQYVFEEKVMSVDNAPPLVVIGAEGIWGVVLTVFIVYPAAYLIPGDDHGSFESPANALELIRNSSTLQAIVFGFVAFVTIYNCLVVYVTKYLSAIWHAILDNFRPITIWGLGLFIYYRYDPGSGYGEAWTSNSWLQLAGLLVLFFGTAIYNGSVGTCDVEYSAIGERIPEHDSKSPIANLIKTDLAMASPSLTRSPLIYEGGRRLSEDLSGRRMRTASGGDINAKSSSLASYYYNA